MTFLLTDKLGGAPTKMPDHNTWREESAIRRSSCSSSSSSIATLYTCYHGDEFWLSSFNIWPVLSYPVSAVVRWSWRPRFQPWPTDTAWTWLHANSAAQSVHVSWLRGRQTTAPPCGRNTTYDFCWVKTIFSPTRLISFDADELLDMGRPCILQAIYSANTMSTWRNGYLYKNLMGSFTPYW